MCDIVIQNIDDSLSFEHCIDKIDHDLVFCPICTDIIEEPIYICGCNHKFCRKCIEDWCAKHTYCPTCRQDCSSGVFKEDDVIEKATFRCPFTGCDKILLRNDLKRHEDECLFIQLKCQLCESIMTRGESLRHKIQCEFCEKNMCNNISDAHNEECPEFLISCKYDCGVKYPRKSANKHDPFCKSKIQCKNGCDASIHVKNLAKHDKVCKNKTIECTNKCGKVICRGDVDDHDTICEEKTMTCSKCYSVVKRKNLTVHMTMCRRVKGKRQK